MFGICSSAVDWSATGSMLSGLGTLGGVGAVIWAAKKAANTFDAWKKQKLTERKLMEAERILTATYHANDALSFIRSRFTSQYELEEARPTVEANPYWHAMIKAKQDRLTQAQAKFNRIKQVAERSKALVDCLPMAKALFGDELERAISKLHHQFWIVRVNVESYVDDDGVSDPAFTKKVREAIWSSENDTEDEVSKIVIESIATIERNCLPLLREA